MELIILNIDLLVMLLQVGKFKLNLMISLEESHSTPRYLFEMQLTFSLRKSLCSLPSFVDHLSNSKFAELSRLQDSEYSASASSIESAPDIRLCT